MVVFSVNWPALGAVLVPNLGGFVGAIAVRKNLPWYEGLNKPEWRPPNWAFGPVWTVLYSSIGYGSYLVYQSGGGFNETTRLPLALYGANLALNWAWTPIFFGSRNIKLGLIEINLINLSAAATGLLFYQVNKSAGLLFVPYLMWLGLATALTYRVYKDNPKPRIVEVKDE